MTSLTFHRSLVVLCKPPNVVVIVPKRLESFLTVASAVCSECLLDFQRMNKCHIVSQSRVCLEYWVENDA